MTSFVIVFQQKETFETNSSLLLKAMEAEMVRRSLKKTL